MRKLHEGEKSVENEDDVGIVIAAKSGPFYQITGLFRQIGIFLNDL